MKKLLMVCAIVAMALGSTACFHNKVIVSPDYDPSATSPDSEEISFHLFGLIGLIGNKTDLDEVCPGGTGIVENRQFLANLGIGQTRIFCTSTSAEKTEAVAPEVAALNNK